MTEYKKVTLADITTELSDGLHAAPIFCIGGDYIFVNAKNLVNGRIVDVDKEKKTSYEEYLKYRIELDENTILYSIDGTIGNIAKYRGEKVVLGKGACYLKLKPTVDADYIYFYLMSPQFNDYIYSMSTGSTIKHISLKTMRNHSLNLPDLNTQKRISSVLLSVQNKIDLNEQINQNLQEQAFALFDHYFHSVIEGNTAIGDYITPKRGKNLLSKDAVTGEVPVVAGGLEPATYHNTANTSSPVVTISASGANSGFVRLWNTPVWSSDSSYIDSTMTPNVYFWYVMLKKRQKEIYDSQTGSAQPHIYPQNIAVMPVDSLDDALIDKYTEQVTPLFRMIGANIDENKKLICLRDTLLPKLMSGELDVSEIEL